MEWFNAVDATYRSDLRELNELNFARFDAKLEQRVAEFDAKLDRRIAELRADMREGSHASISALLNSRPSSRTACSHFGLPKPPQPLGWSSASSNS